MEVKEKSKKRELIKSIAIVFLVILLLLTFFSNTIMNYSLAEVATEPISSGTINAKIRGSGTVEANESYEVILPQTREVRSINVQVGDIVSEGDVLFILGDQESSELKAAQEQLDTLELQYQQQLLTLSREQAGEDRTVQVLREELQEAQARRDENLVTAEELAAAKSSLAAMQSSLDQTTRTLEELNAALSDDEAYTLAKANVDTWKTKTEAAQALIEQYTKELNEFSLNGSADIDRKIQEANLAVSTAMTDLNSAWTVYSSSYIALVQSVIAASIDPNAAAAFAGISGGSSSFSITSLQQAYVDAYLSANPTDSNKTAYSVLMEKYTAVQDANTTLQKLYQEKNTSQNSSSYEYAAIQNKLNTANSDYAAAKRQLEEAQWTLESASAKLSTLKEQIKSYEATEREQTANVKTLTNELTALESRKDVYDQAGELVKQKQKAIEDALVGRDIDKQLDNLNLQSMRDQIEKAQALVERYTAETVDTAICANVSGMISAINVTAGKEAAAGSTMATIELTDRGYALKIAVTNEQSRQVRVGDTANVTNYYWGEDVEAVLESIIADPANPGKGKLLVFRVSGDVDAGTNLTLSIGQRSATYDTIIPKSALRQDANGYFVLVITVKSTPLSNRYIATRVDVQVLAEDDTSAAVSGLSSGDFVITTANKPVEAGNQVRMVENP